MPANRLVAKAGSDAGFALIITLWTLLFIALVVALLTTSGRTEIRIARNLVVNAEAAAAADGGVYQAIFNLIEPHQGARWSLDGRNYRITLGNCIVSIRLEDEAA